MLVRITHLKAPWPAGACVGDVVRLDGDAVPAWAAGKCAPAPAGDAVPADTLAPAPAAPVDAEQPALHAAAARQKKAHAKAG